MSPTDLNGINCELIKGRRVCVTGRLVSMTHSDFAAFVQSCDGEFLPNPKRVGYLLVIGSDGWPADQDGAPTTILRRSRQLQARGYPIEFISEEDFLDKVGLSESAGAIRGHHTITDLSRILDVAPTKIRQWVRIGLIQPVESKYRLATFDFHQVSNAKRLCGLLESGVSLSAIRKGVEQLTRWLPPENLPLSQVVELEQRRVVLRFNGVLMESSGQQLFDFEYTERNTATLVAPGQNETPSVDELFDLALELEDSGRLVEAVEYYRQAIELQPNDPILHFNLGNTLFGIGRYEETIASFEKALEHDPEYAEAWNNLGNTYAELKSWDEAIRSLRQALQLIPTYADAHYNLADIYKRVGRISESTSHIEAHRKYSSTDRLLTPPTEASRLFRVLEADPG